MIDQVTDVRSTVAALRRRSRILVAAALVGLILGITYVMVQPPLLTSTTLVLLPTPTLDQGSGTGVETQVRIARSATVLGAAGEMMEPKLAVGAVEKLVDASAPTNQIIEIQVASADATQAQALSQAVADSYIDYVRDTANAISSAALADLYAREENLQAQISALQDQIDATTARQQRVDAASPDGLREAQLLAGLRTEQADLSLQLDKVQDDIATRAPSGSSARASTTVIQPATTAVGPSTARRMLTWAPIGAVLGTLLAVAVLFTVSRRHPRVGLRDEIADAVGSPVLAALRSRPQRSVGAWRTLLETYTASPTESWAFRQLLRGLVPPEQAQNRRAERVAGQVDHPLSITIVSLAGETRGLAIGPQLAAFASSLGIATHLVAAVGEDHAAALWAACAADGPCALRPSLFIGEVPSGTQVDLTISLVVVDRRKPDLGHAAKTDATVLAVAAAAATEQELARLAVAVDDAGSRIDGIVVADPDPMDRTYGRQTLHERVRQVALPVRLTGVGSADPTAGDPRTHA